MNSKQRQQIVDSYSPEHARPSQVQLAGDALNGPGSHLGLILKCVACAALIVLLLTIGIGTEDTPRIAKEARIDALNPAAVAPPSSAAANRKEVFDARRARFEAKDSTSGRRFAVAEAPPQSPGDATCSGGVDGGMDASGNECSIGR